MQIGYVKKLEMAVRDGETIKKIPYFEMTIKPVFGNKAKFSMKKNKSENENSPAYDLYAHNEKGWIGRKMKVGALWLREYEETTFMSGAIESPLFAGGKLPIALFSSKPLYESEEVDWLYDVVWKPYTPKVEQSDDDGYTQAPATNYETPDIDISEDEIPF